MGHLWTPRLDPTRVPTVPVELDRAHPLGLVTQSLWMPALGLRDFGPGANNLTASASVALSGSRYGPVVSLAGSNVGFSASQSASLAAGGGFSLLSLVNVTGNATGNTILNYAVSAQYHSYELYCDYFSGGYNIHFLAYGGFNIASANALWTSGWHAIAATWDGTAANVYFDGANAASGTGSADTEGGTRLLTIGYGNSQFVGQIALLAKCRGALAPPLIARFTAEPFAMLRPRVRRSWYVPASGGANASVATNLGALSVVSSATSTNAASAGAILGSLSASAQAASQNDVTAAATLGAAALGTSAALENDAQVAASLGAATLALDAEITNPSSVAVPLGAVSAEASSGSAAGASVEIGLGAAGFQATGATTNPASTTVPLPGLNAAAHAQQTNDSGVAAALGSIATSVRAATTNTAAMGTPVGSIRVSSSAATENMASAVAGLGALSLISNASTSGAVSKIALGALGASLGVTQENIASAGLSLGTISPEIFVESTIEAASTIEVGALGIIGSAKNGPANQGISPAMTRFSIPSSATRISIPKAMTQYRIPGA